MADPVKAQQQIQEEFAEIQNLQKELKKFMEARQKLVEQQNESDLVKKEIDILEPEAVVYKQIGPALIKQSLEECRATVDKRLDFIIKEQKNLDLVMKDVEAKIMDRRNKIIKIQENFQKARQQQMAAVQQSAQYQQQMAMLQQQQQKPM